MVRVPYLWMAAASAVAALLFFAVARTVAKRGYADGLRFPAVAFVVSWGCLALVALNDAGRILIAAFDPVHATPYYTLARIKIVMGGAAIWGFGVYVAYLWTGASRRWAWVIGLFALSHMLLFLTLVEMRVPDGVGLGEYAPRMQFERTLSMPGWMGPLVLVYYFAPPVVLALFFLGLWGRVTDRTVHFRLLASALAIVVFQVAGTFHSNPRLTGSEPVLPLLGALMVAAGLLAAMSYHPPAWVRRRLGLRAALDPTARSTGAALGR